MDKNKQTEKVLQYIKANGSIDPIKAMQELGIMRLGARVFDLKASGVPIKTNIVTRINANGERKRWAEYSLAET